MNRFHRWICRSGYWKKRLEERALPWALSGIELGPDVLEIGPGPGLSTDFLRSRLNRLTVVEIDSRLAASLGAKLCGTNVKVVCGDATSLPIEGNIFSGAVSFTMLHHVPSGPLQNELLREVQRVLKPGGVFAGVDSRWSWRMRVLHIWDTLVPVDPATFGARLRSSGFTNIFIDVKESIFRFSATRE
jgi:SAM-dependent methyltransferase